LLALVAQGHERAFEALVQRYRKPLLSYCRRLSLTDGRAEDILQLALLKTWIAVREGAEVRDLKAWLYRVVHNTAVNAMRDAAHDGEPLTDPEAQPAGGTSSDMERGLNMRETLAGVAALPPLQREVIVRTAMAGHSHEQVASDLGITGGAVRGLLYRARTTLRTAVTALTPPQLLSWLAGRADQGGPGPERLTELAGGGGAMGISGLLLKGGVVAITAGTVLTGAAVVHLTGSTHRHTPRPLIAAVAPTGTATTGTPTVEAGTSLGTARGGSSAPGSPSNHVRRAGGPGRHTRTDGVTGARGGSGSGAPTGSAPGSRHTPSSSTPRDRGKALGGTPGGSGNAPAPATAPSTGQGSSGATGSAPNGNSEEAQATPVSTASSNAPGGAGGAQGQGAGGSETQPSGGGQSGAGTEGTGSEGSSSGSSGSSGSESTGSSKSTGGATGQESGSLVGTVVHEVSNIVEHLLH
jgi:RNA polymerase sigma factor (sigma-70 family)